MYGSMGSSFVWADIALGAAAVGMVSLFMAIYQRIWPGLAALAAGIWLTVSGDGPELWLILPAGLLMLIFVLIGREPGTGILKDGARLAATITAIAGLAVFMLVMLL